MQITGNTVTPNDAAPVVSRRLEVPSDLSCDGLNLVPQAAFGWHSAHLNQFCADEPYEYSAERWDVPDFAVSPEELRADKPTLAKAIASVGAAGLA